MTTSLARWASVLAMVGLTACLPIPNRVTDVVEVSGIILESGRPVVGTRVSVERPQYLGYDQRAACSGVAPVVTDSAGRFTSPRRQKWLAWVFLLGESPEWRIPFRVCVQKPTGWRELFFTRANGWDPPMLLRCDIAAAGVIDPRAEASGPCELVTVK